MLTKLMDNLTLAIDSLVPLTTVIPKKRQPPWIDNELNVLYRKRDAALRRYKSTGNRSLLEEFLLRRQATDTTKQARTRYIHQRLKKTMDNNGNFWKELRKLGLFPKSSDGLHGFSLNKLNNHFAAVSCSTSENSDETTAVINTAPEEGFTFKHVWINDVILVVSHFTSQAKGEDGIPQSVIAKALPAIAPLLVNIFNTSLDNGLPGILEESTATALEKEISTNNCFGLSPDCIALLSLQGPREIGTRTTTGIYYPIKMTLLKMTDDVRSGLDKKLITVALLFDFSKAFDTISRTALL